MKKPLRFCRTFFYVGHDFDYATPLRAMAQWVKRHPESVVISVGVNTDSEGGIAVTLTVEDVPPEAYGGD